MTHENGGAFGPSGGFELPTIELGFNESAVADEVVAALAAAGVAYDFGGRLADVSEDESGRRAVRRLTGALLRERISAVCRLYTETTDPNYGTARRKFVRPPGWLVDAIADRGNWPGVPILRGVVYAPVLRPDGSICQACGYDAKTGLWVDVPEDFPTIPESPTETEAEIAAATLFVIVQDFPWKDQAAFSAWLAALLSIIGREAYAGPAPLFLVSSNVRGSGKSLLCDILSEIACGYPAARTVYSSDENELAKQILAIADSAERVVLFDNLAGKIGGSTLDACLTGTTWRGRILGRTEVVTRPLRTVFLASGNNCQLQADTARRTVPIALHSSLETPEDRSDFRHQDILSFVRANRAGLLASALILLRRFVSAGRPTQNLKPLGSFIGWGDLIRGAVVFANLPDPCEGRAELVETADSEAVALRAFLRSLWELDRSGKGMKTADVLAIVQGTSSGEPADALCGAAESLCDCSAGKLTARKLGIRLGHFRGRVAGGLALESRTLKGSLLWLAKPVGGCDEPEAFVAPADVPESLQDFSWAESAFV